ncbi:S1C family serine protease [Caldimonas sp. KR1-144]|uniref:S1C family serine protease n=1 Tax=Caldimonas sp. KR1-144 TaxID=3400911 RepID=UPI003C0F4D31
MLLRSLCLAAACCLSAAATHAADPEPSRQAQALRQASDAVIGLDVTVADGARSIETLGRQRSGSGVVIGPDELVLTIGYLILEADDVQIALDSGKRVPARVIAYDLASGFGLVQPLVPLGIVPAPLAPPGADTPAGEPLMVVSGGDEGALSIARLASRRAFSGYWEYHIEGALFTAPARTDHSGAGLFNAQGELLGIGSLLVMDAMGDGERSPGNMFVPAALLPPILAELRQHGSSQASHRAWLGLNCVEQQGSVRIVRISRDSPAEHADMRVGDVIKSIDGRPVASLEAFYKTLWAGSAERDVQLALQRDGRERQVVVRSVDRMQTLARAKGI